LSAPLSDSRDYHAGRTCAPPEHARARFLHL
jgi:hypothetical protein